MASGSTSTAARVANDLRTKSMEGAKKIYGCGASGCIGFRDFLIRGNVVDLAVAFVVGAAFTKLIEQFVASFVTPLIAAIFGGKNKDFASLFFTLNGSQFKYGAFINAFIAFIIICLVVYFLIVMPLMRLLEKLDPKTAVRPCPECLSDIPGGARRCKFCGANVPLGAAFMKRMKMDETGELAAELKDVQAAQV